MSFSCDRDLTLYFTDISLNHLTQGEGETEKWEEGKWVELKRNIILFCCQENSTGHLKYSLSLLHLDQVFQQSHIWWLWLCSNDPVVQEIQTLKQWLLACAVYGSWTALEYLPAWCNIYCEWMKKLSSEQMTHGHINDSPVLDRGGQTQAHTSLRLSSWLHSAEVSGLLSVL